jgi:hypothetical protein
VQNFPGFTHQVQQNLLTPNKLGNSFCDNYRSDFPKITSLPAKAAARDLQAAIDFVIPGF